MRRLKKEEKNESGKNEWNNSKGVGAVAASFDTFLDIVSQEMEQGRRKERLRNGFLRI